RWSAAVNDSARATLEQKYGLTRGAVREGRTWGYYITDLSTSNIRSLVQDPAIEDTHEIHRTKFRIWRTATRDPYSGPYAGWLPYLLQFLTFLFLIMGAFPAVLAVLEAVGMPSGLQARLMPVTRAFAERPARAYDVGRRMIR